MPPEPPNDEKPRRKQHFATTCWSKVAAAGGAKSDDAPVAFSELCQDYWQPLYAYIRGRGYSAADAQDLTQAFFGQRLELTADAARQAAHRLRKRYRALLREEVGRTVADPAEVDEEVAALFRALGD